MHNATELCQNLGHKLAAYLTANNIQHPLLVGIHTGGVWLAEALNRQLKLDTPIGTLDISFYRDDFSQHGLHPQVKGSNLPWDINERHIVLVDDVIKSGRTVRAAMNVLFDFARPLSISLACLADVGQRELPITANVCALNLALQHNEYLELKGPNPLELQQYTRQEVL